MPKLMTYEAGHRAAVTVGAGTLVIGGAMLTAPRSAGPLIGLVEPRSARMIGVLDLALAPGLLAGRPRWPWLAARAVTNLAMAVYALRLPPGDRRQVVRARAFAVALLVATVADSTAAAAIRRSD